MIKVLFVCLGNICRSPMAEGLFINLVKQAGLEDQFQIDSCGTGAWHAGERADPRMREVAERYHIELPSYARQVRESDFTTFDYIIPMDGSNKRDLEGLAARIPDLKAHIIKMRYFDPEAKNADVPDPYYGGKSGFEDVYQMLLRSNQELLAFIRKTHQI